MISFGPIESKSNGYFVRSFHITKSLAEFGHKVVVLEFSDVKLSNIVESGKGVAFIHLRGNETNHNVLSRTLKKMLTFDLFHLVKFQLFSLVELIRFRENIKQCDFVFVEGALIPFAIILGSFLGKKIVLDTHGISKRLALSYKEYNRLVYLVRTLFWHVLESFAFAFSDFIIVVSEEEKFYLPRAYNVKMPTIFLVPNIYVKLDKQKYSRQDFEILREKWRLRNKVIITFVGDLTVVQNRDAMEYILNELAPNFSQKRTDVVFLIIGRCEQNCACNLTNVVFTGFVENLTPFLEMSDICIAPLRVGCGVKTKVLQYLAYGKPIVTSPIGIEGIETKGLKATIVSPIISFDRALLGAVYNLSQLKKDASENQKIFERRYSLRSFSRSLKECVDYVRKNI
jgi:glycosyltransferase involved in cell wall biosynthesis